MDAHDLRSLAQEFLDEPDRSQLQRVGDVTAAAGDPETVRVHVTRVAQGVALTLRFLARTVPSIEELDLPEILAQIVRRPHGLVVLGGPTGSGKTTTLAALVAAINRDCAKKIVTIEDPIEYRIASARSVVVQRQAGRDVPDFAHAVIGALRSDPDVIVIGEIRDAQTVAAAIAAAETGHLVLATLHTGDASQSVDRLVDAFAGERTEYVRGRIAHVLLCAISQRLVPRASGGGRCLAAEVLVVNDAVRHMIREGKHHQLGSVMATGRALGMQTLAAHLAALVERGDVSPAAAREVLA